MPEYQAVILGILLIAVSGISLSGIFYYNPRNDEERPRRHLEEINFINDNKGDPRISAFRNFLERKYGEREYKVFIHMFENKERPSAVARLLGISPARVIDAADLIRGIMQGWFPEMR